MNRASEAWRPDDDQAVLLDQLAVLIARGGAAHVLDVAVVEADDGAAAGGPPTSAACEALLRQLLWHAHVDLEVELADHRHARGADRREPGSESFTGSEVTVLTWVENRDGVATFALHAIGSDEVTGLFAVEVGRAFASSIADAGPYRAPCEDAVSARDGAIAAIYLGLGVFIAHAAASPRVAAHPPPRLDANPGLAAADVAYLLAVQAVVRARPIAAHASLPRDIARDVHAWIAALTPHRAALCARLGIDLAAPRARLRRPRIVPVAHAAARATYRMPPMASLDQTMRWCFAGGTIGTFGGILLHFSGVLPLAIALAAGGGAMRQLVRRFETLRCMRCGVRLRRAETTCPGCGATIVGTGERDEAAPAAR